MMKKVKTIKTKQLTSDNAAISVLTSHDFIGNYAGNGHTFPFGNATIKTEIKANIDYADEIYPIFNISNYVDIFSSTNVTQQNMKLAKSLCEEHPEICIDPEMLGGVPHLKGIRLSVGDILDKLYVYGSVEKIKEIYGDDISEHQIKEAIAFAQDFLENACVPS